jgi:zinc/manganese transport system substrate-binding protein
MELRTSLIYGGDVLRRRSRPPHPRPVRRLALVAVPVIAVLAAGVLAGCGGDAAGTDAAAGSVVATTTILADITRNVGCGKVDVTSVIPAGSDAHEYEASVQDADRLTGASLVVANGLGLEEGLLDALDGARGDGVEVLAVGESLDPRRSAGADGGSAPDPHVWMDPDRMATAAGKISERLQRVPGLPVGAAEIARCGTDYQARLTALGREMDATLATVAPERRKLVTNHEALGYFAERFGFDVIGAVIPSTSSLGETNPRDLEDLATAVRHAGVPAVFGETTQPEAVARSLADRVGGKVAVVELHTESLGRPGRGADTYVTMMQADARRVADALGR